MLIALFSVMSIAANAGVKVDEFEYRLDTNAKTAELVKYSGSGSQWNVVIPANVTYNDVTYSVTSLGDQCFFQCSSLRSIVIPSSVTSLGVACFAWCSNLRSIDIPSSVTSLGDNCFWGCTSLTSVTIPSSVTNLGASCFRGCSYLETVICKIATPINGDFFNNTPINQATLYVPEASLEEYQKTSPWNVFGTISPLTNEMISISVWGIATYCSNYDLDFTGIVGIKAYVATGFDYNNRSVLLTRVYKVPSGTGFIVMGDEGIYSIPHVDVNYAYANLLIGTTSATELPDTDNGYSNYILANGDVGVTFYISKGGTLAANKAYLHIPTSTSAGCRSLSMTISDDSKTTGIDKLEGNDEKEDTPIYNLNGHRVTFPKNGIYIKNGKTIIIK